jgi:hypothetical protein
VTRRSERLVFVATLATIAGFIGWMARLEPILHDVWHFRHYHRSIGFVDYARWMYLESDARLGNLLLYWLCASKPLHIAWAAAVMVAFLLGLFALALGRWPRPTLADTALLVVLFALYWIAIPLVGVMTFYRPFTAMYLDGLAILVALVLPYRFALASDRPPPRAAWRALAMLPAGVLAGFSNEHTVPTAILALALVIAIVRRRGHGTPAWMVSGLVGLTAGFVALFFAPAQDLRYGGLATKTGILERIVERGAGNLVLLGDLLAAAGWLIALAALALAALAWTRRRGPPGARLLPVDATRASGALFVAALAVFTTTLASPLQGPRLMFAASALLVAAALPLAERTLAHPTARAAIGLAAVVVALAHMAWVGRMYLDIRRDFDRRLEILAAAPPGTTPVVPPFRYRAGTRWFYGDDFRFERRRRRILQRYWNLRGAHYVPLAEAPDTPAAGTPPEATSPTAPKKHGKHRKKRAPRPPSAVPRSSAETARPGD